MAASRKKGDYSVLSEINTEEEWDSLCQRKGLTIVDVYSEWSGPCSAMTNFLKKIKLEVNDDMLQYAMAKSDSIPQLEIFKGHCKPIWLFIASGEPVAVMHGANAPLLQRMIEKEIRKERQVLKGEASRDIITMEEAVPLKSRCKAATNLWADTDEEDNADSIDEDAQVETNEDQSKNFAIMLVESFIYDDQDKYITLKEFLDQEEFEVFKEQDIILTLDDIRMFTSGLTLNEDEHDAIVTHLLETTSKALLIRCNESIKAIPKVNEWIGPLFKDEEPEPESNGDVNLDEAKKKLYVDDDIVIEKDLRTYFCDPNDPNKRVGLLCPDYQGFLVLMEKYFLASLTSVLEGKLDTRIASGTRKLMMLFLEETQHFVLSELAEAKMDILGQCVTTLNADKAKVIIKNSRKEKALSEQDEHKLLVEISNSSLLGIVVIRETKKDLRKAQNKAIRELEPLIVTLHLPSMKILFTNVVTEEINDSGEFMAHIDQGISSDDDDDDESRAKVA